MKYTIVKDGDVGGSKYIFILYFTHGFNEFGKDNYPTRQKTFQFWDLMRLISEVFGNICFKCLNECTFIEASQRNRLLVWCVENTSRQERN